MNSDLIEQKKKKIQKLKLSSLPRLFAFIIYMVSNGENESSLKIRKVEKVFASENTRDIYNYTSRELNNK